MPSRDPGPFVILQTRLLNGAICFEYQDSRGQTRTSVVNLDQLSPRHLSLAVNDDPQGTHRLMVKGGNVCQDVRWTDSPRRLSGPSAAAPPGRPKLKQASFSGTQK